MKRYFVRTFGCQMNEVDSEKIAGWYESRGWRVAKSAEKADEIIINTCSVRQSAEDRVYGLVNNLSKLKIKNLKLKIVVTGCMLRYPLKYLREKLPQVDKFREIKKFQVISHKFSVRRPKAQALVPIMEGCNHFCSYCVVPFARGREKSRPSTEIVCEVTELVGRGYKEITLLGQNVNSYQYDFAKLLSKLNAVEDLEKISFMTSNPWDLTEKIIKAMGLPKIDRYLHLPVQSGDDEILKKMNRPYTAKKYLALVGKIHRRIPDIRIGTDIIVGFPGETQKQFANTVKLCRRVGFAKAYLAIYSPRPGTAAFKLKDDVPLIEKKRRWLILEKLINKRETEK